MKVKFSIILALLFPFFVVAQTGKGIMEFSNIQHDFGYISEKAGPVSFDFKFVNSGKGPISIVNVITSCGCTGSDWTRSPIQPGDTGIVRATFDPDGRQGEFNKTLTVETTGSPTYQNLTIIGHVFASALKYNSTYVYRYGNLAVKSNILTFDRVKDSGYDSTEIGLFNMSNKRIYVYKIEFPPNMYAVRPHDNIPPNTDMRIKLLYYPKKPLEYGPVKQELKIYTNDDSLPVKIFYVNAYVVEDFGPINKKMLRKSPKFVIDKSTADLGNVKLYDSPVAEFKITNKGKTDLVIRRVIRSCSCITPELQKMVIKKGETVSLKVNWSIVNMAGPDSKTLKIITNDPLHPEVTLTVKINVTE